MEQTSLFGGPTAVRPRPVHPRRKRWPTTVPDHNGICWRQPGGYRVCDHDHEHQMHVYWGRCRSGKRWFWAATAVSIGATDAAAEHGWADSEDQAATAARTAVVRLAAGRTAYATMRVGAATSVLKRVNAAKRKQRPASGITDTGEVEYLYGTYTGENANGYLEDRVVSFRITKKTPKRIYYIRHHHEGEDPEIGFVNRQDIEAKGEAHNRARGWWAADFHLYATPPEVNRRPAYRREPEPDLKQLKAAMASSHPDRGGTDAEFIAARARYVAAKRKAGHR
ncbi:hypothetical protein [Streptomyces sp. RPT161]|uniref:hypothetical protein n=1 Tax=Streptomyces sp. RPT161 TaxID=3015993 RepID=UPI0022B86097|nr:hypothetical protein [Streptomyces sp. RPT161]